MSAKRMTMRKIREILRLSLEAGLSIRQIKASTKVSVGGIQKILSRAKSLDLSWPLPEDLTDDLLASRFYPRADASTSSHLQIPDWPEVHQALKQKGVVKQLLWEEYTEQYPNRCMSYSRFCDRYLHWRKQQRRSMRQVHKAGEKVFVDYCGPTIPIINPGTGEIRNAQIFVGVFGASNYTFAEATLSQTLPDWLGSHARMFTFFGGCPALVIPDNLRSGVSRACRYDPDLNPSYQQLAEHYQIAVIPARPYKPKDKAKAEVAVQIVERWILARLRRHSFFSLAEVNQCIQALLVDLNKKPFKQLPGNRLSSFEMLDKPMLKPLPEHPYQFVDIKTVKVNIDYHIDYQQHHYSVPHQYVGERLTLHASDTLITVYFRQRQLASHPRKYVSGASTIDAHMPDRHKKHQQWTPGRLMNWAAGIGPETLTWVRGQLESKSHPEQAYRICLGLLNLSREYPVQRLEAACCLANKESLSRLKQVKSILKTNRDQLPDEAGSQIELPQDHENIRGPQTFH